jgi:hypothetical protein
MARPGVGLTLAGPLTLRFHLPSDLPEHFIDFDSGDDLTAKSGRNYHDQHGE